MDQQEPYKLIVLKATTCKIVLKAITISTYYRGGGTCIDSVNKLVENDNKTSQVNQPAYSQLGSITDVNIICINQSTNFKKRLIDG